MYVPLNKKIVSQRTGKNTVALVGFAATTRDLAPWDDLDTEIWGLNEAAIQPWFKRFDRWFQIHPEDNFMRSENPNDPDHPKWLAEARGFPIYMQEHYDSVPSSVALPIDEIIKLYGNYLTSSLSYMITLAMLEGFERIELYGFELGTRTEYHYQKSNAEYLIGMARGLGFEIYLPPGCSLCKGKMYGFESMEITFRQKLEYRKNGIAAEMSEVRDEAKEAQGMLAVYDKISRLRPDDEELVALWKEQEPITQMKVAKANFITGVNKELETIIGLYDDFLETIGVAPKQDYTKTKKIGDSEIK